MVNCDASTSYLLLVVYRGTIVGVFEKMCRTVDGTGYDNELNVSHTSFVTCRSLNKCKWIPYNIVNLNDFIVN